MKKSAIIDIFNGARGRMDTMKMPPDRYDGGAAESVAYDELAKRLSPELVRLLTKYTDALESSLCDNIDFYFAEGFKLGLLIGIECMDE